MKINIKHKVYNKKQLKSIETYVMKVKTIQETKQNQGKREKIVIMIKTNKGILFSQ